MRPNFEFDPRPDDTIGIRSHQAHQLVNITSSLLVISGNEKKQKEVVGKLADEHCRREQIGAFYIDTAVSSHVLGGSGIMEHHVTPKLGVEVQPHVGLIWEGEKKRGASGVGGWPAWPFVDPGDEARREETRRDETRTDDEIDPHAINPSRFFSSFGLSLSTHCARQLRGGGTDAAWYGQADWRWTLAPMSRRSLVSPLSGLSGFGTDDRSIEILTSQHCAVASEIGARKARIPACPRGRRPLTLLLWSVAFSPWRVRRTDDASTSTVCPEGHGIKRLCGAVESGATMRHVSAAGVLAWMFVCSSRTGRPNVVFTSEGLNRPSRLEPLTPSRRSDIWTEALGDYRSGAGLYPSHRGAVIIACLALFDEDGPTGLGVAGVNSGHGTEHEPHRTASPCMTLNYMTFRCVALPCLAWSCCQHPAFTPTAPARLGVGTGTGTGTGTETGPEPASALPLTMESSMGILGTSSLDIRDTIFDIRYWVQRQLAGAVAVLCITTPASS
ncbi:unnamed protein product [Diplocarpon coronariae]